jgi:hypothetical protein
MTSEKHFALHTLYCNYNLDIADIIIAQPGLQIIGIYSQDVVDISINTLERVRALSESGWIPSVPIFFGVQGVMDYPVYNIDYPGYNDMERHIQAVMAHAQDTSGLHLSYPTLFLDSSFDRPTPYVIPFDRPTHIQYPKHYKDPHISQRHL